ncbi:MAG: hypothetical protein D6732_02080 [Methanobacteriota archaeon]|nr:MAG: hypothetical protein D6732_02080 [Euryarchaeota archaeon]
MKLSNLMILLLSAASVTLTNWSHPIIYVPNSISLGTTDSSNVPHLIPETDQIIGAVVQDPSHKNNALDRNQLSSRVLSQFALTKLKKIGTNLPDSIHVSSAPTIDPIVIVGDQDLLSQAAARGW